MYDGIQFAPDKSIQAIDHVLGKKNVQEAFSLNKMSTPDLKRPHAQPRLRPGYNHPV